MDRRKRKFTKTWIETDWYNYEKKKKQTKSNGSKNELTNTKTFPKEGKIEK